MNLLDSDALQNKVDYSFGDHSGVLGGIPQAFMKKANINNIEFVNKVNEISKTRNVMTLFIDNIRLYQRPIEYSDWLHMKPISIQDRLWLNQFKDEDLLKLCFQMEEMRFIIFTALEDTPLDNFIHSKIPENVFSINAANGVIFGGKIHPYPHGIERKMYIGYDHHEILEEYISKDIKPEKLLFVAHRTDTGNRSQLGKLFNDKDWATVTHLPYEQYLNEMKKHKFVLCPSGNGIESARNWETLYMRRVPVFLNHPYLKEMFKEFPCLFVDDYAEITEELLQKNDFLYQLAQQTDMNKLTLDYWFNKATK